MRIWLVQCTTKRFPDNQPSKRRQTISEIEEIKLSRDDIIHIFVSFSLSLSSLLSFFSYSSKSYNSSKRRKTISEIDRGKLNRDEKLIFHFFDLFPYSLFLAGGLSIFLRAFKLCCSKKKQKLVRTIV